MHEEIASPLRAWESFYVIVGSSAGALTGLQFVVMTLIGESGPSRGRGDTISAFGTPNVVHFCAALLVAAILSVPWSSLPPAGIAVAASGMYGVLYSLVVLRRAQLQQAYRPVLEDWVWHTILPMVAYAALFVAGLAVTRASTGALLVIGTAVLLLVFIGIHNAWDTVTYVTLAQEERLKREEAKVAGGAPPTTAGGADLPASVGSTPAAAAANPEPGPPSASEMPAP